MNVPAMEDRMSIKPATDEQVARFKVRTVLGSLGSEEELSLIARIESDSEVLTKWHESEALCDKELAERDAEIARLKAERDEDRRREYGYLQQVVDALTKERDALKAEVERLSTTCRSCGASGDRPCTDALGYERNRPHPSRGTGRAR